MSGTDYIVDTNIILYILAGELCVKGITEFDIAISVITEIEVLGWQNTNPLFRKNAEGLISECKVLELSQQVKDQTI